MARPIAADSNKSVARVVRIGHALYVTLPQPIARITGIKPGDRVAVETDGRSVVFAKIPFDELINLALLRQNRGLDRNGRNDE